MTDIYHSIIEKEGEDLVVQIPPEIVTALGLEPGKKIDVVWQLANGTVRLKAVPLASGE